jgi:hypothetical protein
MNSVLRLACPSSSGPEASAGRRLLRRRANNDGVHALLVAAVVTKNRPEASKHLRDRTAALEADVFRFLPRDAHRAAPLPFVAAGAPRSCRSGTAYVSLSSGSRACQGQTSPSPYVKNGRCRSLYVKEPRMGGDCGQATPDPESPRLLMQPYAWLLSTANRHTTKRFTSSSWPRRALAVVEGGRHQSTFGWRLSHMIERTTKRRGAAVRSYRGQELVTKSGPTAISLWGPA